MSVKLNTVVGGSGDFSTRSVVYGLLSSGATGDIIIITPPSGERVRLTHLSTENNVASEELSMSLKFGTTTIISLKTLNGAEPTFSKFSVGNYFPYGYAGIVSPQGNSPFFTGKKDEVLTISKTGTTTNTIYYTYEFGA